MIGCTKPLSCNAPPQEIMKCVNRWHQVSDRAMFLKCFPFSGPEHITGVWVSGFETNIFFEGKPVSLKLMYEKQGDTGLVMDKEGPSGPFPQTFAMELIGRRPVCEMGFPHHNIVVDRVISQRELQMP